MATNIISHWTVYAAYTMEEWRLEGPLNINFLAIFLYFPNPYIKWNQKSLGEQGKVGKVQNGSPYWPQHSERKYRVN